MKRKEEVKRINFAMETLQKVQNSIENVFDQKNAELSKTKEDTERWYDLADDKEILSDIVDSIESAIKNCEYFLKW